MNFFNLWNSQKRKRTEKEAQKVNHGLEDANKEADLHMKIFWLT